MKREVQLIEDVIIYLKKLGYTESSIKYEEIINSNSRVDLVVNSSNDNIIAVEIKSDLILNNISQIGYNPIVRQLQRSANQLGAKVYILTNGKSYIWFETGKTGRPVQIDPIPAKNKLANFALDSQQINALIDHVSNFLINFPITGNHSKDLSISIYYKILKDINFDFQSEVHKEEFSYINDKVLIQVLDRWRDINFIQAKTEVLKYIDDFLLQSKSEWQVPRWLANFMVNLYPHNERKNQLLDIFAKYGVLVSSAHLNGWEIVESLYFKQENEYWIKSQQLISNEEYVKTTFSQNLLSDYDFENVESKFDCVLIVPPFGHNIQANYGGNKIDSVELLINKAMNHCKPNGWSIAIVPDGALLSSKFKLFRKNILKKFSIRGIINLTPETFKPYSSVSTSILIIQKKQLESQKVFFSSLDEIPRSNDISNHPIINNWNNFISNLELENNKEGFVVEKLHDSNLHFSNYWFSKYQEGIQELQDSYQTIPLKELIKTIKRGSPFKKDKNEEISYISPASVRSMQLKEEGLLFTSKNKVPPKHIKVNQGDILVNIIGTQKGSAALVTSIFEGLGINQHIVRLEPNTDLIMPYYLTLALNSDYVQKQMEEGSTGSVIPALNLKTFEALYIPVPPFHIQEKICADYKKKQIEVNKIETELNNYKSELNKFLFDLGKEGKIK